MEKTFRHLLALPQGNDQVFLSWRFHKNAGPYTIERKAKSGTWEKITTTDSSTNYLDQTPTAAWYTYRVVTDSTQSEQIKVNSAKPANMLALNAELPIQNADDAFQIISGDITNNNQYGFVVKYNRQGSVWLRGITLQGKSMWDIDCHLPTYGEWGASKIPYHVPFVAWDINNDGRTEIIYHDGGDSWPLITEETKYDQCRDNEKLIIADAATGDPIVTSNWPAKSAKVTMTVGHLKGMDQPASIVIVDETYGNETITCICGKTGNWEWQVKQPRAAGHNHDIADIDDDGKQEIIVGGICYNGDGSVRWQAEPFGHTDVSKPAKIIPGSDGLQLWYLVESDNPGVYLVDKDGKTIWKETFNHAHFGWIAKHSDTDSGLQLHAAEDGRHEFGAADKGMREKEHNPIYLADGTLWCNLSEQQRKSFMPGQWDGGQRTTMLNRKTHEAILLNKDGSEQKLMNLHPSARLGRNLLLCDVLGDYRENIVTIDEDTNRLIMLSNPSVCEQQQESYINDFYYRHDRSQHGSGYYSYVAPH